jgi:hypothetical protein
MMERNNIVKIIAYLSLLTSCIWSITHDNTNNTEDTVITLYILSILSNFIVFYLDLRGIEFLRLLSFAITIILWSNRYFFAIMLAFILFGAQVFFVTDFYAEHEILNDRDRGYHFYLYWTYEYIFGNYEYGSPRNADLEYIRWYHWVFAFLFSFLLTNVLVALIQNSYTVVVGDSVVYDTYLKCGMITEAIELRILGDRLLGRRPPPITTAENLDPNTSEEQSAQHIYLIKEVDSMAVESDDHESHTCLLSTMTSHSLSHLKKEAFKFTTFGNKFDSRKIDTASTLDSAKAHMDTALANFGKTGYFDGTETRRKIIIKKWKDRLDMIKTDNNLLEGAQGDFRRLLWESESQYLEGKMTRLEWEKHEGRMQDSIKGVAEQLGVLARKQNKALEKVVYYGEDLGGEQKIGM